MIHKFLSKMMFLLLTMGIEFELSPCWNIFALPPLVIKESLSCHGQQQKSLQFQIKIRSSYLNRSLSFRFSGVLVVFHDFTFQQNIHHLRNHTFHNNYKVWMEESYQLFSQNSFQKVVYLNHFISKSFVEKTLCCPSMYSNFPSETFRQFSLSQISLHSFSFSSSRVFSNRGRSFSFSIVNFQFIIFITEHFAI